ncbi:hypothetical protein B1J94_00700 [Leptospira kirschneri serovar Grippotyphosa]|nr:hypothetical protein B1J94_00700 [Leptospira kirschneri serovar Grippotyphosa]
MAVKQRFYTKIGWTMVLYGSSHNFQSLTGKSTICESSHRLSYIINFKTFLFCDSSRGVPTD